MRDDRTGGWMFLSCHVRVSRNCLLETGKIMKSKVQWTVIGSRLHKVLFYWSVPEKCISFIVIYILYIYIYLLYICKFIFNIQWDIISMRTFRYKCSRIYRFSLTNILLLNPLFSIETKWSNAVIFVNGYFMSKIKG